MTIIILFLDQHAIDANCGNYVFFQRYVKINEDQKQSCKGLITEDEDNYPLKSEKHQV